MINSPNMYLSILRLYPEVGQKLNLYLATKIIKADITQMQKNSY
jgi:hypothetical protein